MEQVAVRKGNRTRLALMAAARVVFARLGYLNAEIRDITEQAGRATGSFYTYFDNKADLLRQMIAGYQEDLAVLERQPDDRLFETRHEGMVTAWNLSRNHGAVLAALSQAAMVDAEFADTQAKFHQGSIEIYTRLIRHAKSLGLCAGLDTALAAEALTVMFHASQNRRAAIPFDAPDREARDARILQTMLWIADAVLLSPGLDPVVPSLLAQMGADRKT